MALSVLRQNIFLRRNILFSSIPIKQISTSQPRTIHSLVTLFAKPISKVAAAILEEVLVLAGRNCLKNFRPQNIVGRRLEVEAEAKAKAEAEEKACLEANAKTKIEKKIALRLKQRQKKKQKKKSD